MSTKPEFAIRCSSCGFLATGKAHGYFVSDGDGYDEHFEHHLVECPHCRTPHVLRFHRTREVDLAGEYFTEYSPPQVLFPVQTVTLDSSVPENVAKSYLEAHRDFADARGYVSTALMCRRTLETICVEFGATGRNLNGKLKELRDGGIIESRLYEWSNDVLRALGNDAAHEVQDDIKREDAKDALEFTRALIEYLYVFQAAYERFKKRRERTIDPVSNSG